MYGIVHQYRWRQTSKNSNHSNHSLFSLLHSGKCYHIMKTNRGHFRRSYFPQAMGPQIRHNFFHLHFRDTYSHSHTQLYLQGLGLLYHIIHYTIHTHSSHPHPHKSRTFIYIMCIAHVICACILHCASYTEIFIVVVCFLLLFIVVVVVFSPCTVLSFTVVHSGPDILTICPSASPLLALKNYCQELLKMHNENLHGQGYFYSWPHCICICRRFLFRLQNLVEEII